MLTNHINSSLVIDAGEVTSDDNRDTQHDKRKQMVRVMLSLSFITSFHLIQGEIDKDS